MATGYRDAHDFAADRTMYPRGCNSRIKLFSALSPMMNYYQLKGMYFFLFLSINPDLTLFLRRLLLTYERILIVSDR